MSDDKKNSALPPTAYVGTVKAEIRGRIHYVHVSPPPMNASLEELQQALQQNRELLKRCQDDFKHAFIDQAYRMKPPMFINYDGPTQDALMAHLNINVLIPLINIRGGEARFEKVETFPVQQRVELMRTIAKRVAHMEQNQERSNPFETAFIVVVMLIVVMSVLLVGQT